MNLQDMAAGKERVPTVFSDGLRRSADYKGVAGMLDGRSIADAEVLKKISKVAKRGEDPMEFIARSWLAVSPIQAMSVGEINAHVEKQAAALAAPTYITPEGFEVPRDK